MKQALFIEGRRDGYNPVQVGKTITVSKLIEFLEQYNGDTPVFIQNDSGYTFGCITDWSICEGEYDEDDEDEYEVYYN